MQQNAAGGMAQDAQRGRFQRAHQPIGHLGGFQIHVAVDAADDDVEFGQRVFGEIHRAVAPDVAFEAGEDAEREAAAIELAHLLGEGDGALFIQAVGHGEGLRMIGDGDVFVAQRAGGLGHFFERGAAVGFGGVHVEIAADVGELDQLGQAAFERGFDLAAVFAQLRRNPVRGRARRTLLPRFRRRRAASLSTRNRPYSLSVRPSFKRAAAQRDVVLLAAGEILHGRAVAFMRERAQVHLQAFEAILNAGFVGAFAEHAVRLGMLRRSAPARAAAPGPVTSRSRSPMVSLPRRRLPAGGDFFDASGFGKIGDQFGGDLLVRSSAGSGRCAGDIARWT